MSGDVINVSAAADAVALGGAAGAAARVGGRDTSSARGKSSGGARSRDLCRIGQDRKGGRGGGVRTGERRRAEHRSIII